MTTEGPPRAAQLFVRTNFSIRSEARPQDSTDVDTKVIGLPTSSAYKMCRTP